MQGNIELTAAHFNVQAQVLVQDEIKNVLLNKKKIEYLKQLEYDIYQEGLLNNKIKIY